MSIAPFIVTANKLKNIQSTLEKNEQLLLEYITNYLDTGIVECWRSLEASRSKVLKRLQDDIQNLYVFSNNIKMAVNGELDSIDFKQLKIDMELTQSNIRYLKQDAMVTLDNLYSNEQELSKELAMYEEKIHKWDKSHILMPDTLKDNIINKDTRIDKNVTDFLTFVAKSGGHENGWSVEDHRLFLKVKMKYRNEQEIAKYLHARLPDLSEQDIIAHNKWHEKYLELWNEQRDAIKKWRLSKSAPTFKPEVQVANCPPRAITSISKNSFVLKEMQEKLKMWKQEKKDRLENEKNLRMQADIQKKQTEVKRKQKYQQLKESVQNWRSITAERTQMEKSELSIVKRKEKEFRSALANRLIKEFQSRDDIFMKKRKECCRPKMKTEDKSSAGVNIPRDPNRLFKPTKQWILRTSAEENCNKVENVCSIIQIPKLGVPEWRKHLAM